MRREKVYQFAWRPRPKSILNAEQKKAALKTLRKYEKIFDKEDRARKNQVNSVLLAERRRMATSFLTLMAERRVEYEGSRPLRIALRDGYDSEDDSHFEIVVKVAILFPIVIISCSPNNVMRFLCLFVLVL